MYAWATYFIQASQCLYYRYLKLFRSTLGGGQRGLVLAVRVFSSIARGRDWPFSQGMCPGL